MTDYSFLVVALRVILVVALVGALWSLLRWHDSHRPLTHKKWVEYMGITEADAQSFGLNFDHTRRIYRETILRGGYTARGATALIYRDDRDWIYITQDTPPAMIIIGDTAYQIHFPSIGGDHRANASSPPREVNATWIKAAYADGWRNTRLGAVFGSVLDLGGEITEPVGFVFCGPPGLTYLYQRVSQPTLVAYVRGRVQHGHTPTVYAKIPGLEIV